MITGAWKFDRPPTVPVPIVPGGFFRMRNGQTAYIQSVVEIPPRDSSIHPTWYGWRGLVAETGRSKTWHLNGDFSPMAEWPEDIVDVVTQ